MRVLDSLTLRAFTILKKGGVRLAYATPKGFCFKVKQRSGAWTEVWLKVKGDKLWECNARGKRFGCVMNNKSDRTVPYCSHTKAVHLWLLQRGVKYLESEDTTKILKKLCES